MNKGTFLASTALFSLISGCIDTNEQLKTSWPHLKLIFNNGYAAYRIDDKPWIEIKGTITLPALDSFETLSIADFCFEEGEHFEGKIHKQITAPLLSNIKSKGRTEVYEVGCTSESDYEPSEYRYSFTSHHADIIDRGIDIPESKYIWYVDRYGTTYLETDEFYKQGPLAAIGKVVFTTDHYIHIQENFSYKNDENYFYGIDFLDKNSAPLEQEVVSWPDNVTYARHLSFSGIPFNFSISLENHYLEDTTYFIIPNHIFPASAVYHESWSGEGLSVSTVSKSPRNSNPLPTISNDSKNISIVLNDDRSIVASETYTENSFMGLETTGYEIEYKNENFHILVSDHTLKSSSFSVPALENVELPNFPAQQLLDLSSINLITVSILKGDVKFTKDIGDKQIRIRKQLAF